MTDADDDGLALVAGVFLAGAAAAPVVVAVVVVAALLVPGITALPPPPAPPAARVSRVYDAGGAEIARFHEHDRHVPVEPQDIPGHLKQAVVAAEDTSFYAHSGLDLRSVLRALVADVRAGGFEQGGSTITQQYVKNAFTGTERTLGRKVREAVLARRLERGLDKEEILFRYLSTVYLGNGAYGVGAAASIYFRKPVAELTLSESALLAGIIPAPSRYDPRSHPDAAERKRLLVLDKMLAQGRIGADEHAAAEAERIWLSAKAPPPGARVVRPAPPAPDRHPYFVDYVRRYLEARVGREALRRGGLEIHTTLDAGAQAAAERAVARTLDGVPPPLDMALVAVEPQTGFVKALVGGRDFGAPGGQVNLALGRCPDRRDVPVDVPAACWGDERLAIDGGGTGRQPGSSWKPFVLAAALDEGMSLTRSYRAPGSYRVPGCSTGDGCVIRNFGGRRFGRTTLKEATVRSVNTVYAQVIGDVGVTEVGDMARRLGISTAWVATPERHGTSYALGVQEVAPLEMASAYGVFATGGMRADPTPVVYVRGPDGEMLEDNRGRRPERVISRDVAGGVTAALEGVIERGTGRAADFGRPAAGKTGTAQAFRDAWFVGYTPRLSTAVWMGNRQRPASMVDVRGVGRVTGGSLPADTWQRFMSEAMDGVAEVPFDAPPADALRRQASAAAPAPAGHRQAAPGGASSSGPAPSARAMQPPSAPAPGPGPATTTTTSTVPMATTTTTRPPPPPGLLTRLLRP